STTWNGSSAPSWKRRPMRRKRRWCSKRSRTCCACGPTSRRLRDGGGLALAPSPATRYKAATSPTTGRASMATERTLSIIKPDATRRNLTGKVNARLEEAGLRIVAQKRLWLTRKQAEAFYAVHRERPFFNSLCDFMSSGPVVAQVLEGESAVAKNRD